MNTYERQTLNKNRNGGYDSEMQSDGLIVSHSWSDDAWDILRKLRYGKKPVFPPVSPGKRILAFIIDYLLMSILVGISTLFGGIYYPYCALFAVMLYKPITEFLYGGSIGKRFLGLCVTNLDGKMLTLKQAFLRNILIILVCGLAFLQKQWPIILPVPENIISVVGGVVSVPFYGDILFAVIRKDRRALHDVWSNSYCMETDYYTIKAIRGLNKRRSMNAAEA